ncbi:DUF1573 domain-containing protein [Labilibaculum sp. DW002]|uniref:DUF1573 domain-containing protein n=1 Tax=Paralabilibaculum antarcticum TaxID=2912572 RepID=A0ABT5VRA8_9BACT|nr:DUF1573 domain-containing protein [Labilibaculum sp. DW002]MDE5417938.1 DUF1573 domain-containing protein [Labilibaculum sp. DW002]
MKKIYLVPIAVLSLLFLVWAFVGDYSFVTINTTPTQIEFDKTEIDMGKLEQGKPNEVSFQFVNTGEYPLLIKYVETSCGCTKPEWPKHPINPGNSEEIKVTYDAKYPGRFFKTITVFCNSKEGMITLKIKGEVKLSENSK